MSGIDEQTQAEHLARWLADPDASIPPELDHDVVEAIIALHPERAPAHRVSAESILTSVREGPLAENSMEVTAVPPYVTPVPANRPWGMMALVTGSAGALVAALALFSVGTFVGLQSLERSSSPEFDGVAAAPAEIPEVRGLRDTGLVPQAVKRDGLAASSAKAKPTPRPSPRPTPSPAPVADAAGGPPADPYAGDAVVEAEPLEGGDAYDDAPLDDQLEDLDARGFQSGGGGVAAPRAPAMAPSASQPDAKPKGAASGTAADEPARLAAEKRQAGEAAQEAKQAEESRSYRGAEEVLAKDRAEAEAEARAEEEARRAAAANAARAASAAREQRAATDAESEEAVSEADDAPMLDEIAQGAPAQASRDLGRKSKKEASERRRAPSAAEAPPPPPSAPAREPIPEATTSTASATPGPKTGTSGVVDPQVTQARTALSHGDSITAMNAITIGLSKNPGDTRVRQLLLALQGDVYAAQGNMDAANRAWASATAIAVRLQ